MSLGGTVLVVDDHIHLAENLAEILEGVGYQVEVADSAEAALTRIERGGVVALITDYRLPGLTGAGLIAALRQRGWDMPALVMSAFTDDETIATSRSAGAYDVLAKPIEIERLLELVGTMGDDERLILLAEDNNELAENLTEILKSGGHEVYVTSSMQEAVATTPPPSIAILDYHLPDGDGVEIAERLAARNPGLQVLFISGHTDELRTRLSGRLAAAHSLEKPIDIASLLTWVQTAVQHGQTQRPRR
ncbi:MAG TPA: response regulator [Polyangia bacterium]